MPKQPTYIAGSNPITGAQSVATIGAIDITKLGEGLQVYGRGEIYKQREAQRLLEKRKAQQDDLWSRENAMAASKGVLEWYNEAAKDPKQSAISDWEKYWNGYTSEVLKNAPSEEAANDISLRLGSLELQMMPKVFGLKASADRTYAINSFTNMRQASSDLITLSPSMQTLNQAKGEMYVAIDNMEDMLGPEIATKLRNEMVQLNLEAADLWAMDDPALARQAVNEARGIPADVRAAALKKISAAENSVNSANRVLFDREKDSYISSLKINGAGNFDTEGYIQSFPASQRVGKRTELKDDEAIARGYYNFTQAVVGKSAPEIDALLATYQPEAGADIHDRKTRLFTELSQLASQQKKLLATDGFTASMQSPAVKQLFETADQEDPVNMQDVIATSLKAQADMGIPQGNRKVASSEQLTQIANQLNKGNVVDVINGINQLKSLYGQYYPDLFRNLLELPSDTRVSTNLSMIHEHIDGEKTPPWVSNFIEASRRSYKDLGFTQQEADDYRATVNKSAFRDLQRSLYGELGAPSFEASQEVLGALTKYAMFLDASGEAEGRGKASKQAVDQLINSVTYFGEAQGKTYRIPKKTPDGEIDEYTAKKIRFALTATLNTTLQDKYAAVHNGPDNVPTPFHIRMLDEKQFGFADGASADFKYKAMVDAIRTHGYWATTPDDTGVILMSKTSDTQRNNPVLGRDGKPIYVSFKEAAAWTDALRAYTIATTPSLPFSPGGY